MKYTKEIFSISKNDVLSAGGKGASLGEMMRAGIPVPPGFVILSSAFERFLEKTGLITEIDAAFDAVNHEEVHTVENASRKITALILGVEIPQEIMIEIKKSFEELGSTFVAVRSSATAEDSSTAAWAGQLESYLNTTSKTLLDNVKKCWASLYTPRAIFYRFEKKFHKEKVSVAVVVQKMVQSEESGIAFSVHPVTEDYNQLIIEAGFGLGEAIVSGQITPDSYVVRKKELEIEEKIVNEQEKKLVKKTIGGIEWINVLQPTKQVLTDTEIITLSKLIIKIEKHYGFPVDIEWTREKGRFYIVQSRPITTLTNKLTNNNKVNVEKKTVKKIHTTKIVLNKLFTRPLNLATMEGYSESLNVVLPKLIGFKFKNTLMYSEKGVVEVWRNNAESTDRLVSYLLKIVKSSFDFDSFVKNYELSVDNLVLLVKKKLNPKDLSKFSNLWTYGGAGMIVVYWLSKFGKGKIKKVCEHLRKKSEKMYYYGNDFYQKYINFISRKENIDLKLIDCLTRKELINYFEKKTLPSKTTLEKRYNGTALFNHKQIIIPRPNLQNFFEKKNIKLEKEETSFKDKIKGHTTYKGHVKGIVKILKHHRSISKFNKGDILVSPMTTPNFISAIKKAAAIVTDEGGMLSHAAIVSRELGKPCIVGTKIATKVLKDGDMVEVDADKGIVRKIK